jgi:hypothetical protein
MAGVLALSPSSGHTQSSVSDHANDSRSSLFAQSVSQVLNRDFPNRNISFLVFDAQTGTVLASRWDTPKRRFLSDHW